MSGVFVAIVGPSGVGKDSLIRLAQERLGREMTFVRRVVTRPADGGSEDHDTMSAEDFARAEAAGQFALSWEAHGLRYGLPIALERDLAAGRIVVANLSRGVIPALMARYGDAVVVSVVAEREVIARRLAGRGRETADSIQRRLERSVPGDRLPPGTVVIDNSGALETAGAQLVRLLEDLAGLRVD